MDAAEENAKIMMSDTEVLKKATAEAQAMNAEAEEHYRKMDYEARSLAFNILTRRRNPFWTGFRSSRTASVSWWRSDAAKPPVALRRHAGRVSGREAAGETIAKRSPKGKKKNSDEVSEFFFGAATET